MIYVLFSEREETYSYNDQQFYLFSSFEKAKEKLDKMRAEFLKHNSIKEDDKSIEDDSEDSKAYEDKYCRYNLYIVKRKIDEEKEFNE